MTAFRLLTEPQRIFWSWLFDRRSKNGYASSLNSCPQGVAVRFSREVGGGGNEIEDKQLINADG